MSGRRQVRRRGLATRWQRRPPPRRRPGLGGVRVGAGPRRRRPRARHRQRAGHGRAPAASPSSTTGAASVGSSPSRAPGRAPSYRAPDRRTGRGPVSLTGCPRSLLLTPSPTWSSSSPTPTATSAVVSSRPTAGRGSRSGARWSRATARRSRRAPWSACTTTFTRPTTGTCCAARPGSSSTTSGSGRPPRAPPWCSTSTGTATGGVHPTRRRPRVRVAHRCAPVVPGRQLLQPGRRARRGLGRPRHRRRLGASHAGALGARPVQPPPQRHRARACSPTTACAPRHRLTSEHP